MSARAPIWLLVSLFVAAGCGGSGEEAPPSHCGDGVLDAGEECDDGSANSDALPGACRRDCTAARCGDGVVDPGEACDEGEFNDDLLPDACRTTCALPACGDGVVDAGEECDDGAENDDTLPDACRSGCVAPSCGDGVRDAAEGCDDGAENDDTLPDACRTTCVPAGCGDGVVDAGEACDQGEDNSDEDPGACRTICRWPGCGDGVLDEGEACDDGAENDDTAPDACRTTCVLAFCGDGVVDAGEECDDGAENDDESPGACRTTCRRAHCGDGVIDEGEACDDGPGNEEARPDGCRPGCVPPSCGDGVRDSGEGCDHGAANSDETPGACRTSCTVPRCGDEVVDPGEECDEGEANGRPDGCRITCRLPRCGDGIVDTGEVCDDGNNDLNDDCGQCAFRDPGTLCSTDVVDLAGGAPWDGGAIEYEGSLALARPQSRPTCLTASVPGTIHVVPVPREGNLVAEVLGLDPDAEPVVTIREECGWGELACGATPPSGGAAVAVAEGVHPGQGILWIAVQDRAETGGDYRLRVTLTAPLARGEACRTSGVGGTCTRPLVCVDPDGDGTGSCGPLVAPGEACDPAGIADRCVDSLCTCPAPGCTTGVCTSSCGDGVRQHWEACDDGDPAGADNCTAACEVAGASCGQPFRLHAAPVDGGYEWTDDTNRSSEVFLASCGLTESNPALMGMFTAPEAGHWAFEVTPLSSWDPVLSPTTGSCGGPELACRATSGITPVPVVRVSLQAGQTVWPVVTGTGSYGRGPFTLRVQRVTCGNGVVEPSEDCDDGNLEDGDTCSSTCTVAGRDCGYPWPLAWDATAGEAVWSGNLIGAANRFRPSCGETGDGDMVARFVAPHAGDFSFELDGGDHSPALSLRQGPCAASSELACSQLEHPGNTRNLVLTLAAGQEVWVVVDSYLGYSSAGDFTVRVRPAVCGDGIRVFAEECDDGNAVAGDGCSPTCAIEAAETEPNQTTATANPVAVNGAIVAALMPRNDEDWFAFQATAGTPYTLAVSAGQRGNCLQVQGYDPRLALELFDGAGTMVADSTGDPAKGWYCPRLAWTATTGGTVYVRVRWNASYVREVPQYFLEIAAPEP